MDDAATQIVFRNKLRPSRKSSIVPAFEAKTFETAIKEAAD